MSQHTPGPWLIREMYVGTRRHRIEINAPLVGGHGEHPICQIPSGFTNQDHDARLITAAPDLISVCKEVLDWQRAFLKLDFEIEKRLRAAIAKAEGGAS